jgi:hypothetical protein
MLTRAIPAAALLLASLQPRPAAALDEEAFQVTLAPVLAFVPQDEAVGTGFRAEGRYGLTDAVSVWGAAGSSWHWLAEGTGRAITAGTGLTLAFDVLRVVPFVEAGASFANLGYGGRSRSYLGAELGAGAEYLITPAFSLAGVLRAQHFPVSLSGNLVGRSGTLLSVGARFGYTF